MKENRIMIRNKSGKEKMWGAPWLLLIKANIL